jgi:hypothetical protein
MKHRDASKRLLLFLILLCMASTGPVFAGTTDTLPDGGKRINVIIGSRIRKIDFASFSFQAQAGIQRLFHRQKIFLVYVDSIEEAAERVRKLMARKKARVGYLWFDSHGHFGRRISLFEVGKDEVNYQTIHEPHIHGALTEIGRYCDSSTVIGLGSCYSGATFTQQAIDSFPAQRMQGDSLMRAVSMVMGDATVYGSESWVMTKPFIFGGDFALAGGPSAKRFHDPVLLQAWETLGRWWAYDSRSESFRRIPTVAMNGRGEIFSKHREFESKPSKQKKQQRIIRNLKPGNYSPNWYVKYRKPKHH